jgi:mono/diheme cytochrome c family protein
MNKLFITAFAAILILASCTRDRSKPNIQYMPDMYVSVPYEPYGINSIMRDSMAAQTPPEGTIARGKMPFAYDSSFDAYNIAKDSLHSPLAVNSFNLDKGKHLFNIYCAICHGEEGDGQGNLVKRQKFFGVPHFKDRDITEGTIYHVIYYGRGLMGSHASQLTEKERWQEVQYVQKLKSKY